MLLPHTAVRSGAPAPRRCARAVAAACLSSSVLLADRARCQVNVEPLRDRLRDRGHTLHLRAALSERSGNTESLTLGVGTLAGLAGERNLFYLTATADYERAGGETTVAKAFSHARYNRLLLPRVWGELFGQLETDRFRRMTLRALAGTGPRFEVHTEKTLSLIYGASYMLEHTERNDEVPPGERRRTNHRFNNYATANYEPHDQIELSETFYYQPRFDDFGDFWLLSVFAARFVVTDKLSTQIDFTLRHESRAPPSVERTDTELVSSLAVTF